MKRRKFLESIGAMGLTIGSYAKSVGFANGEGKSRVVIVREPSVLTPENRINGDVVQKMVDLSVKRLTGEPTPEDAWKKLFSPKDVVGIKVNCLFGPTASTSREIVNAIIKGLISAGVLENNIIVWDRSEGDLRKSGFTINRSGTGVQYYATDSPGAGYESTRISKGSFNGRVSRILTERITALINAPILKDHNIAGVTIAMKNHYGSIDNPGDHHGNNCDPYIADLNSIPAIKDKTRLIICDAIRPIANGGPGDSPGYRWKYGGIITSQDPVALDYIGWQIIEERRKEIGLRDLASVGRPPKWIATASKLGLGTNDPEKIELIKIDKLEIITKTDLDRAIKEFKEGKISEEEVKAIISKYMESE